MRVEACCQALLKHILPEVDPTGEGHCLDVGVGTFAFYCELSAKLGFPTVAVEPLPIKALRRLCDRYSIQLVEACLSDHTGTQTMYMGQFARFANRNFNSLEAKWFGSSPQTKQVKTLDLRELLRITDIQKLTYLKLDIEGWEPIVIQQLLDLPPAQLPILTMFEYGGGGPRHRGGKGWSPAFLDGTLTCLKILRQCGYGFSIVIDYAANADIRVLDLQSHSLDPDKLFTPSAIYGNIISFRGCDFSEAAIARIAAPYRGGIVNRLVEKLVANG